MKNVSAVIGANYGDEGKGHFTDFLATPESLVVRFNGGAQAGHTVVTTDGRRHVFHHFGSGTLIGAKTFLSPFFLANPVIFTDELNELKALGIKPEVFVDPRCPVTTPFDMMLNQAIEAQRGNGKHGSCGLGINETIVRCEKPKYILTAADLYMMSRTELYNKLSLIRDEYVPLRMAELGIAEEIPNLLGEGILRHFLYDVLGFVDHAKSQYWDYSAVFGVSNIVFEGAQGLRLDEKSTDFPYVTRSRTGLTNVARLMRFADMNYTRLSAYYVSRPYITRHGAGPLPHELPNSPYSSIQDVTNVPNKHQGTLRFAWMESDRTASDIRNDIMQVKDLVASAHLVMTCVDQLPSEMITWVDSGKEKTTSVYDLANTIRSKANMNRPMFASGPTRDQVWF